jgi:hypothetical protein
VGIAQKHGAAGRGGHAKFWRGPHHIGAIGVGQNEAHILREVVAWHALGDREEKPVAIGAIVLPCVIGAEVREGGFDFDNKDLAVARKRDNVGVSSRDERQFGQCRKIEPP